MSGNGDTDWPDGTPEQCVRWLSDEIVEGHVIGISGFLVSKHGVQPFSSGDPTHEQIIMGCEMLKHRVIQSLEDD